MVSCYGGAAKVLEFWERLPEAVRTIVKDAGFGEFVSILTRASSDRQLMRALVEWW